MVEQELQQLIEAIPDIRWLRIVSVHGLSHPRYRFDAGGIKRDTELDLEEDRFGPMSIATFSLSERVSDVLGLGDARFTVIAGKEALHFWLPVGDGSEWEISFAVSGHPSIDRILTYFKDRDYLASLVPML